ncbi:MAG TPA: response regulator, partial [Thermoanaerobaculia bacterium]
QPLTQAAVDAMASVADEIALGIDRSRATEGLRASEASTRALIDNMLTGVITTDEKGKIETINPAAIKMFGWSAEELVGQDLTVLLPASVGRDPRAFLRLGHVKALGRVTEWEARRKNGDVFPMELALSDFRTPDGRKHSAGSVRDISERLEIERVKKEFVSTVSHELRTPLTSIRGSLGLIAGGVAGEIPERARALLDIAYKNTERLSRLVNDILDLEKIESGRMELRLDFLELGQILRAVLESNQTYAEQYSVRLAIDGDTSPAWVWVDRDRVIQVFTNLVSNAVKFSPPGAIVTLTRSRVGERVRVSVVDRGPGIPEEFRPRIFQRFQQADSSDTRQKGGTGLGLAITKSIVERLNGEIGFETHLGTGTTFYVDLPEQPAAMIAPEAASGGPRGRHILVCEDDTDHANLLSVILQRGGCQTEIAQSAAEAKALLSQRHFDAMTLHILLPGQDGISLLSELRADERTKELPIVVVSLGRSGDSPSLAGDAFGIIDWLAKPIDASRLLASVRQAAVGKAGTRPRILHVEDDPDVVAVLATLLNDRAEVFAVGTVREAEKALREGNYDLLVLDIELPDGSGLSLLPLLHSTGRPPVPVVVFSAHELSYGVAQAIEATLVKSETSNEEILHTIESLLNLPQPGAA